MAYDKGRLKSQPLVLRQESSNLILGREVATRIENFRSTEETTLRTVHGPAPLVPQSNGAWPTAYGTMYGIYHTTLLNGTKDILLLHSGTSIWMYQGWNTGTPWKKVVSDSGSPLLTLPLTEPTTPQFPTQFETTPKGVVVVPQDEQRAVFFNGTVVVPLGYDTLPPAPIGYGPESSAANSPNDKGYSVSRASAGYTLHPDFGYGRLGTVDHARAGAKPRLQNGAYQCSYQWINYFGDLSPLSSRSNEVRFAEQESSSLTTTPEEVRKQVLWTNIAVGPDGTIGRILNRSHDLLHSGSLELFIVPGNAGYGSISAFATMPDNIAVKWPDNVPDIWCVAPAHDPMPVPIFKLCRLAFGRLWIANTIDDPGILIPSMVGRYGTFEDNSQIFPDPSGGEITGLWAVDNGLLVFTRTSTYIVTKNDSGEGFRSSTLNPNIGCVAPSSIANMPDGSTVWLGREGFYRFSKKGFELVSAPNNVEMRRVNNLRARQACAAYDPVSKEYRCWVSLDSSRANNTCFIYDGTGWRRRTTEEVASVCVTKDHRDYMLAAGTVKDSTDTDNVGVWALDRQVSTFEPKVHTAEVETAWMSWVESIMRKTAKTVYIAFREASNAAATVSVYRDWRKTATATYTDSTTATLYSPEDSPPFWGEASWGASEEWIKKRPYWKRVDIDIPSCEVYKIIISMDTSAEFIGIILDDEPKMGGLGTRIP